MRFDPRSASNRSLFYSGLIHGLVERPARLCRNKARDFGKCFDAP